MKKTLFTMITALLMTALCLTALLPAAVSESMGMMDADTLQLAALNASVIDENDLGANIPTEGANVPGATIDGTYRPENAGNMEVLYANGGVAYDATNAPEGAILINSAEDWENQVCAATETIKKWEETGELNEFWEPIMGWVEHTVPVPDTRVYILTADITITTSKGAVGGPFKGIVYGNGHTITTDVPVFNAASGAKFYDLTIVSTNGIVDSEATPLAVSTDNKQPKTLGALVCVGAGCGYYNVLNTAAVTSQQAQTFVGGIQGGSIRKATSDADTCAAGDVVFERCRNTGAITAKSYAGGLAGVMYTDDGDITVKNCINEGAVTTTGDTAGGIAAGMHNASAEGAITVENVLNTAVITAAHTLGGIVGVMGNGITAADSATPRFTTVLFRNVVNTASLTLLTSSNGATGGIAGAIAVASDLSTGGLFAGDFWNDADITFENCYNGGTITARWAGGLFSRGVSTAMTISHFTNAGKIREREDGGTNYSGATGGICSNWNAAPVAKIIAVRFCLNTAEITGYRPAGFFGILAGDIESAVMDTCLNTAEIVGAYAPAGLYSWANVSGNPFVMMNCQNDGAVEGAWPAGLVSRPQATSHFTFRNCTNNGDITSNIASGAANGAAGGFVNVADSSPSNAANVANQFAWINCVNNGTVKSDRAGGFIGFAPADPNVGCNEKGNTNKYTVKNCVNNGEIVSTGWFAGGFSAYLHGEYDVVGFVNNAKVTSTYSHPGTSTTMYGHASGFVAHAMYPFGVVSGVVNNGAITAPMTRNQASQSDALSFAESKMGAAAGGVFGYVYGWSAELLIDGCINEATVSGQNAGGVVGAATRFSSLTIDSCINKGDIISTTAIANMQGAGGIAGAINLQYGAPDGGCQIVGCINLGAVSAVANAAGGILGYSTANNNVDVETGADISGAWTITGNVNMGSVTAQSGVAGGIAGAINTAIKPVTVTNNRSSGVVTGDTSAAVLGALGEDSAAPTVAFNLFDGTLEGETKVYAGGVANLDESENLSLLPLDGAHAVSVEQLANGEAAAALGEGWEQLVTCQQAASNTPIPVDAKEVYLAVFCDGEHTYTEIVFDDEGHQSACVCGAVLDDKQPHVLDTAWSYEETADGKYHYQACTACAYKGNYGECTAKVANCIDNHKCEVCGGGQTPRDHYYIGYSGQEPDCEHDGWTSYNICSFCGDMQGKEILPACHLFEIIPEIPAGCEEFGWTEHEVCVRCGFTQGKELIMPAGHEAIWISGFFSTCTSDGYTDSEICLRCGMTISPMIKIPQLDHNFVLVEAKPPSCLIEGYTQHYECTECGSTVGKSKLIAFHEYEEVEGRAPSCTEFGYSAHQRCKFCGDEQGKLILDILPHAWSDVAEKAASCTEDGWTAHKECQSCGLLDGKEILPAVHAYVQQDGKQPTCLEKGYTSYRLCTICGEVEGKSELGILPHSFVAIEAKEKTCTEDGWTAHSLCTGCQNTMGKTVIPAGHEYRTVEGLDPTCTEDGYTSYQKCAVCGDEQGKSILAAGHIYVAVAGKLASCTEDGYLDHKRCTLCGDEQGKSVLPATGHAWNAEDGVCKTCLTACEHKFEDSVCTICGYEALFEGIVEVNGVLYYFENGVKTYKGLFLYTDGHYYYAKSNGALAVNVTVNCTKTACDLPTGNYRFDEQGRACNGIFESNGKLRYYENGKGFAKGFFKLENDYYYAKEGGWLVVNAKFAPPDTNCDLPANTNYYFDAEGKLYQGIYFVSGYYRYYLNGKACAAGLVKIGEDYYYAKGNGIIAIDEKVYATQSSCDLPINTNYLFDEEGKAYQGIRENASGKLTYYVNGKGANVGLFLYTDGKYYFAAGSGLLIVDRVGYNAYKTSCDLPAGIYDFDATGAVIGYGAGSECKHVYTATVVDPTCKEDGKTVYTCSRCGDSYEEIIPATGEHSYEVEKEYAASCNKEGVILYRCSVCGDSYEERIPATGKHNYASETFAPTCTDDGFTVYTCSLCGNSYEEWIITDGHNYVDDVCTVCGDVFPRYELQFTQVDGGYEVSGYTDLWVDGYANTAVVIPATYNGMPVVSIGRGVFAYEEDLRTVVIPEGVRKIGIGAFQNCYLKSITIPASVQVIANSAFRDSISLSSVVIVEGSVLRTIGAYAFMGCIRLTGINLPETATDIGQDALNFSFISQ